MKVAVRNSGVSTQQIANGLVCNGANSVNFALANDAENTAKCMANKSKGNHQEFLAKI
ncbi:MAG: hypothetical protein ACI9LX_003097 [Paraglaciecola sp.]